MAEENQLDQSKKGPLYILIICLTAASIAYRISHMSGMQGSSILFVGVPALITLLVVRYAKKPSNTYGAVFLVITIFLLMSAILFGEGFVCILIVSPLFYVVGAILVLIIDWLNDRRRSNLKTVAIIPVLLIIGQVWQNLDDPQVNDIIVSKNFPTHLSISDFNKNPNLSEDLPFFLTLGFPKPTKVKLHGMNKGDKLNVSFLSSTRGVGDVVFVIDSIDEDHMMLKADSDESHIGRWMSWKESNINLIHVEDSTKVEWKLTYTCNLQPAWYFNTLMKYAVGLSGQHLIDNFFQQEEQ